MSVLALGLDEPLFFPVRDGVAGTLVAVSASVVLLATRSRRRALAAAAATAACLAAWSPMSRILDERAVLAASGQPVAALGRHFVVGYTDVAAVRRLAAKGLIGGIFLTRRNVEGRTSEAVRAEIAGLQAARHASGSPPLVVAADQEGGAVSHLSPPLAARPSLSTLVERPSRREAARDQGVEEGRELGSIGVTMDLAPVVDLAPGRGPDRLDLRTLLRKRAISADPVVVAEVAAGFAAGLADSGITATAKHFPGLGRVATGTHLFAAAMTRPIDDLDARDWLPFQALIAQPGAAIMLSHVSLETVDPGVPSSASRKVAQGVLRERLGFGRIEITDDLSMGAIAHYGLCRAVTQSLNAGIDLLLVSWDIDKIYPALRCALRAQAAGQVDAATASASGDRLDRLSRHR